MSRVAGCLIITVICGFLIVQERQMQIEHKKFSTPFAPRRLTMADHRTLEIFKLYKPHQRPIICAVIRSDELDDSFHKAIRPVACFVQFLFLMPVCGVSDDSPKNVVFKWTSLRVLLTLFYIFYGMTTVLLFLYSLRGGINSLNVVGLVFFTYTTVCTVIFLLIAKKWPRMMRDWERVEERFLRPPYKYVDYKLSTKVQVTAICVVFLAFVEHLLYITNQAYSKLRNARENNVTIDNHFDFFMRGQFNYIYDHIDYSPPLGIFNELMNLSFTFGWNYMELFVMMVSLGLSTRFKQINQYMLCFEGKKVSEYQWAKLREDYSCLCDLVGIIDYDLRFLILLSNLNNLYFICYQILNIFDKLPYFIDVIYFWFSLIYLGTRTLVAQFMAASIHESSKFPIKLIGTISPESWCSEMQRFVDQARAQDIALSGMGFFYLTRRTILSMLATIVTYELVLMQLRHGV